MILEKIFFSYSRADASDFALRLALDLKKQGFNIWIDQEDIRAGSEWDLEIEKALETCDCLLFIETEKSVTSNNVLDEVYYALEKHKKVIPLILVDSKTPFRLQRLQHIDFTKDYNSGLVLLINELKGETAAESFEPVERRSSVKVNEPFYKKYAGLTLIIASLIVVIAAAFFYTANNKKETQSENYTIVSSKDTVTSDYKSVESEPKEILKNDAVTKEDMDEKKIKVKGRNKTVTTTDNKIVNNTDNKIVNNTDNKIEDLNKTFAGDWTLVEVDPKARLKSGYLKIEALDKEKVVIKSSLKFYYFKTNDTAFLSVFNGFAGCASCILEKDMKIKAEDIAIGSQVYTILKQDQPDGTKAGDTVMSMGANKSIHASVTLHLINNNTAVIKVKQPLATEISTGVILQPFVYSFRFTKDE